MYQILENQAGNYIMMESYNIHRLSVMQNNWTMVYLITFYFLDLGHGCQLTKYKKAIVTDL